MLENKTKPTRASVGNFIKSLPEPRRADAKALVRLMQSVSGQKPRMWGAAIIGFGSHHYRYDSGREGDMPLICFLRASRQRLSTTWLQPENRCSKS